MRREELVEQQEPFAVILGCSDSRVPAEILFDQGLGDLFVIRVAGNVAAPTQLGSIEYAVKYLGARLVVVLGHTGCGAIAETLKGMATPSPDLSPNIRALTDRITAALKGIAHLDSAKAVRANILASKAGLVRDSAVLKDMVENGGLLIVGAKYSLETGRVEFLNPNP